MSDSENIKSVTQNHEVLTLKDDRAYLIPCDVWKGIKTKIRRIPANNHWYDGFSSTLLGVGITSIISLITSNPIYSVTFAWVIASVSIVAWGLIFVFSKKEKADISNSTDNIIEYMDEIEAKFED